MPTEANSINASTTGIVGNTGTGFTGTAVTQYNVLTGAATSSTLNNVAPSATSGVPLISQGNAAQPVFGTAVVAGGGTGVATLTGLALGSGTSAFTGVTYTAATSWTPVMTFGGGSTGITYTLQTGVYQVIGNCVYFICNITLSNKGSSTGNAIITGLPVNQNTGTSRNPIAIKDITLTAGNLEAYFQIPTNTLVLYQSDITGSQTQLTNTNFSNTSQFLCQGIYFT